MKKYMDNLLARVTEGCAEAVYSASDSFSVEVRGGEILEYSVSDTRSLKLRVLRDGHIGSANTECFDEEAAEQLVAEAEENLALSESKDEAFLYAGGEPYAEVNLYNEAIPALSAAEKIAMSKKLEELVLAQDKRITRSEGCGVFTGVSEMTMRNTLGLDVSEKSSLIGAYAVAIAEENGESNSGVEYICARDPQKIDLEAIAAKAARKALDGLNASPVPSGAYRVLLSNEASTTFLSTFFSVFSAESAQKGLSLLKGKEGTVIAAECLSVLDDPHREGGVDSAKCDGEGVPTAFKRVVDHGTLTTLLHNLKTANKQGVKTTGNASEGKGISANNFHIEPGEDDFEAMLRKTGDGLYITSMMGMHAGADAVSGDFSLYAKGFTVEDGKLGRAVKQITIAGNYLEMLKLVEAVGSDLRFGTSGFGSPCLLVSTLAVAGQ